MFRAGLALILLSACGGGTAEPPDATPLPPTDKVDFLFVIDDSATSADLQQTLNGQFAELTSSLASRFGGQLPDVHVGVVSGDMGAGGYSIYGCDDPPEGGAGRLQATPRGACDGPSGAWLVDRPDGAGGRERNTTGPLEEAFYCVASLGIDGCGFQQHLGALRAALDGRHPEHAGFLRDDAILVIVIAADDDDCTASDPAVFDPDPPSGSELGPLSSGRCARLGWLCNGQPIPEGAGTYLDCEPRGAPYFVHPDEIVTFLRGVKRDPRMVVTAALTADKSPAVFEVNNQGATSQVNICTAQPHSTNIRVRHLSDSMGGLWIDNCTDDVRPGLARLGDLVADRMGAPLP